MRERVSERAREKERETERERERERQYAQASWSCLAVVRIVSCRSSRGAVHDVTHPVTRTSMSHVSGERGMSVSIG